MASPHYTDIDIVNMALTDIGEAPIQALSQNSSTAKKVDAIFELKRDELLRMHPWAFAKKRIKLAEAIEKPAWGYTKNFIIPDDCLRILEIDTGNCPFHKEGKYIATDVGTVGLLYIRRENDANLYDASFVSLFSKYLAASLAWSIKGSRTLRSDLMNEFNRDLALARGYSAMEGTPHAAMEFDGDGIVAASPRVGRISAY